MKNTTTPNTRPQILTWLCLASFIAGSLWIIMLLALSILSFTDNLKHGLFPGLSIEYLHTGYLFISVLIVLTLIGIIGVVKMWQLKKYGFYLYAAAKTLIYFLPVLFIGFNHLTYPGLLITSVFIIAYGVLFTNLSGRELLGK